MSLDLPINLFPSGLPTKTLYAFQEFFVRATYPAYLVHLDLRFLIIVGEEYNECSSALCNFLHSPVISSSLGQIYFRHFILEHSKSLLVSIGETPSFTTI